MACLSGVDFGYGLIPAAQLVPMVRQWIRDDIPSFDVGGMVVGKEQRTAKLYMKSPGVLAGKPFFDAVFACVGKGNCVVSWEDLAVEGRYLDADNTNKKMILATVSGPANELLQAERTALCALSRCSGVATATREAVRIARNVCISDGGETWNGWVAGTRKTTPGFRVVEKYGLLVGGAATHRLDLSQMVMLKDNHIVSAGSIARAVEIARSAAGFSQKIEVECRSLDDAIEAAEAGADIVMLDNFTPDKLKSDACTLKKQFPHVLIEASGGITTETMAEYLSENVDIVSQGKLTQGYSCLDFSLKITR